MEIVVLIASSSQPEPYEVIVSVESAALAIRCTCPAGEWGKYCKHKAAVVLGDSTALYGDDQSERFEQARKWIVESSLPKLFAEIADAEKKAAAATAFAKKTKETVAKSMNEGVALGN
jgi:uncharacterized Zn finger protein